MKAILTSDWHLRRESEDVVFEVIDKLEEAALKHDAMLLHLGDLYHSRNDIDPAIQNRLVDRLEKLKVEAKIVPGNHDMYNRAQGRNCLEVLDHVDGVHVQNHLADFVDGVAYLPYRKDIESYLTVLESMPYKRLAFVHHGLIGARMNTNVVAGEGDGIPPAWFKDFDAVFLGHWHEHQVIGNCVYVGSPWQTRADEAGQQKGYILLDMDSLEWSFHPLSVGRRYHRHPTADSLGLIAPGDRVFTDDESVAKKLRQDGVDVVLEKPVEKYQPRYKLSGGMREAARAYVEERAGDLDLTKCMAAFDEVTS